MIDCLIVDDEQDSVNLLTFYANKIPNMNLISATTNPVEALSLINENKIEIAFCDIQMPLISGIDIAKAAMGKCKLVFITAYKDFALEGYEHDVVDYLLKPVTFSKFMTTFQKVEKFFWPEQTKVFSIDEKFKDSGLSKREIEVIYLMVKNKKAKDIASELNIAESTVNTHIAHIYKKLKVNTKYDIISKYFNSNGN